MLLIFAVHNDLSSVYRVGRDSELLSVRSHFENDGEFDPGSGRTLAAWIRHASRTVGTFRGSESGERVSNT